jgi:hypothetical protein
MKRFYYLSVFTLVAAGLSVFCDDAGAIGKKVVNSGNASAKGGNGGNAQGQGSHGGNGGSAAAQAGSILTTKSGAIINSGNATAIGGNGGNAKGKGAVGGNGGGAVAVGGDIGQKPIDPGIGNGKTKTGSGTANAGNATATGGNGGNASGNGAQGGNGGGAVAVSGNGNTVINGNNNTIIGKVVNNNISINVGGFGGGGFGGGFVTGGGAFASGGFAGDGLVPGTPGVAVASAGGETVITNDGSPAIAAGQNGKDNVEAGEVEQVFTRRFVKVKNDTDQPMKVFVQYRGMDDKKWAWLPADPSESKDALVYDLKAGQEMYLEAKGSKVSASRVRIWGVAQSQSWFDFRDQDLWVVPEMDQRGEHRYQATEMKTFTFVFPKKTSESK